MHTDLADDRIINPSADDEDRAYKRALRVEDETFALMTTPSEVASILEDIGLDVAARLAMICHALERAPYVDTDYWESAAIGDMREIHKSIKQEAKRRAELWMEKDYGDE